MAQHGIQGGRRGPPGKLKGHETVVQGAYIAEAGMDPIAWVQIKDSVLSVYATAVAEQIHADRAQRQKEIESG